MGLEEQAGRENQSTINTGVRRLIWIALYKTYTCIFMQDYAKETQKNHAENQYTKLTTADWRNMIKFAYLYILSIPLCE